jgi:hypothetical protein
MKRALEPAQPPRSGLVPVRSPSGHLIGYLDRARLVLQVKPRAGRPTEEIDLALLLRMP